MEDTVKQLRLDEGELDSKIKRRRQELERAEKRMKGIENVKPEYQEEYERLEAELERFYMIYVEKFSNIDYLEYELDRYNLQEQKNQKEAEKVIHALQKGHKDAENEEIFNDDDEDGAVANKKQKDKLFNDMRETRTGFGPKANGGAGGKNLKAEGGLQPDDDDDEDVGEDDDEEEGDDQDDGQVDDDEEEGSDHDF